MKRFMFWDFLSFFIHFVLFQKSGSIFLPLFTACIMLKMHVRNWYSAVLLKCWSLANLVLLRQHIFLHQTISSSLFSCFKGCPLLLHVSGRERYSYFWDDWKTTWRRYADSYGHRRTVREQANTSKHLQSHLSTCFGLVLVSDSRVSAIDVANSHSTRCDGLFWLHSVILKPLISLY